jgi:hypothetical protein
MTEQFVTIVKRKPDNQLSDRELIQRLQAEGYIDPQMCYGIFAYRRNFNPGIDAPQFNEIFLGTSPNPHETREAIPFFATHLDRELDRKCNILIEDGIAAIIWEFGMTSTTPLHLLDMERYVPLAISPASTSSLMPNN